MAMDMDIDMNLDLDIEVEVQMDEAQPILSMQPESHSQTGYQSSQNDQAAAQIVPHKVHLRGLDNLTTKDIEAFAAEYSTTEVFEKVEWIDDSSANLVYSSSEAARQALTHFSIEDISMSELPLLQMIPAKPFPAHPDTRLEVRVATMGDRKQAGARERSRFYLFNPEHDRGEKRDEGSRGGRKYRDREDGGGYRNNKYNDRENRRRQASERFDASLYDDDEQSLLKRRDSSSSDSHEHRRGRPAVGKELFPERLSVNGRGRLGRDRSASPSRDRDGDMSMASKGTELERRRARNEQGSKENRHKASLLKNTLRDAAAAPKELFPQRPVSRHRRTSAIDARDETADLFASKASFKDGRLNGGDPISKITRSGDQHNGINIRGTADVERLPELSIKGASKKVKELFPAKAMTGNAGKELFGNRGAQRRRAEDLFG